MPQKVIPASADPRANLQGADYYRYVAQNDPDQATRAAAQAWLTRNGAAGSSAEKQYVPGPSSGDISYPEEQKTQYNINFDSPEIQALYRSDPRVKSIIDSVYASGDSSPIDAMVYALQASDYSNTPFGATEAEKALEQYNQILSPYFDQQKEKETGDVSSALGAKKAAYEGFLNKADMQFKQDKLDADEEAAQNGVLFSSSRKQKLSNLQGSYQNAANVEQSKYVNDVGSIARDYEYKYGNDAGNTLSSFYSAPTASFNAMGGRGAVNRGSLSGIYNPDATDFTGTQKSAQKTAAIQGAAGLLANKGNKLLGAYGNTWQY